MFTFALTNVAMKGYSLKVWFAQNGWVWVTLCDVTGRPTEPLIQHKAMMHSDKVGSVLACLDVCGRKVLKDAVDAGLV